MTKEQYIEAWTKILFHGVLAVMLLSLLYLIRDILVIFFVAIIFTASVAPAVVRLAAGVLVRAGTVCAQAGTLTVSTQTAVRAN